MDDYSYQALRSAIGEATGFFLQRQDDAKLAALVEGRIRARGLPSFEGYCALLSADTQEGSAERRELLASLIPGETFFFRDHGQFELLRQALLPELIERRESVRRLRLWSAGCATGEEAYSLAITVDQLLPERDGWEILILGTDINRELLEKAEAGFFPEWSFRGTDPKLRERYFRQGPGSGEWQIDERIRRMVSFREADLINDLFPRPNSELNQMDLILCRNVFIYLTQEAISAVLAKMSATLAADGYLITGHNELFAQAPGTLAARVFPQSVVYRRRAAQDAPSPPALPAVAHPKNPGVHGKKDPHAHHPVHARPIPERCSIDQAWSAADAGKHREAEKICRALIEADPVSVEPYFLLAQIAVEAGARAEALSLLKKVLYLAPDHVAAYLEIASLYQSEGQAEAARKMRQVAIGLLRKLPASAVVAPYHTATAGGILAYLMAAQANNRMS